MAEVTLVVPCFNEAERLDLAAFEEALGAHGSLRYVFVDDGSTDGTADLLEGFSRRRPGSVRLVSLGSNRGKAEAVRQGCRAALEEDPELFGYWDADLATPLSEVPRFETVFQRRPEVGLVLGSRVKLMGRTIVRSRARHYLGRVFATFASITLDLPVYDTQCGAKMLRARETSRRLFDEPFRTRWIFDVELIARYLEEESARGVEPRGSTIHELPLRTWVDEGDSKVAARDFLRAPWELWRIGRAYGARP